MVDKNVKKAKAKRNRVWFDTRLGTISFASKKHPERQKTKMALLAFLEKEGYRI